MPDRYPLTRDLQWYIDNEHGFGRILDLGMIQPRLGVLYSWSAAELSIPELSTLVHDGVPAYSWDVTDVEPWDPATGRLARGEIGAPRTRTSTSWRSLVTGGRTARSSWHGPCACSVRLSELPRRSESTRLDVEGRVPGSEPTGRLAGSRGACGGEARRRRPHAGERRRGVRRPLAEGAERRRWPVPVAADGL